MDRRAGGGEVEVRGQRSEVSETEVPAKRGVNSARKLRGEDEIRFGERLGGLPFVLLS